MRDAGPLEPFLEGGVCVLDGGLATELDRRGADLSDALWSARVLLESPEAIVDVHRAYFEAGADVAITASYQASEQGFASRGIDREGTATLLRRSVELAQEARDHWLASPTAQACARPRPLVAASVGPYGAVLADGSEYRGDYGVSHHALTEFHLARLEPLVQAAPDLLAIETIPSAIEAEAIVETLARLGDPVPAWCTFTLRDGGHLADGGSLDDAVQAAIASPSIVAVGVNCSPPASALEAVARIAKTASLPVVAYPNRGADWDADAKAWAGGADVDMAGVATGLVEAGATVVGGCCGTGPGDVRAIATAVGARAPHGHG
ncbi:MAG: homocysteine S-methyltransferase [Actinomycetota bacterium]